MSNSTKRRSAKKMYIAVGLNEVDFERDWSLPEKSPYFQVALVFFAANDKRARQHAKTLLVNEPSYVQQIGRINVDSTGVKLTEECPQIGEFHLLHMGVNESCIFVHKGKGTYLQTEESRRVDRYLGDRRKAGQLEGEPE